MSFQITTAFVQQYQDNVTFLAQQKGSRLRNAVTIKDNVVGKSVFFDQIGAVSARRNAPRHSDSPLMSTPHSRRRADMVDIDAGDLLDKADEPKLLIDPTSKYSTNLGWAIGREMDDLMLEAMTGSAASGETGATSTALPAGQIIASGSAGLTVAKLRNARKILKAAEVDPDMDPFYIAVTAKLMDDLLATTEVTSSDFNTVKALVQGEVDTFLGFKFIHTERLNTNGSGELQCMAWAKSGVGLGIGRDIVGEVDRRSDKRFAWYAYYCAVAGSVRIEDAKVVEIDCVA